MLIKVFPAVAALLLVLGGINSPVLSAQSSPRLDSLLTLPDDTLKLSSMLEELSAYNRKNPDDAQVYSAGGLAISLALNEPEFIARFLYDRAIYKGFVKGQMDSAVYYNAAAIARLDDQLHGKVKLELLRFNSFLFSVLEDYGASVENSLQILPLLRARKDYTGIVETYTVISSGLTSLGENDRSMRYRRKGYSLALANGNDYDKSSAAGSLAYGFSLTGQLDSALYFADESIRYAEALDVPPRTARAYALRAEVRQKAGRYEAALQDWDAVRRIDGSEIRNSELLNLGELYYRMERGPEALAALRGAVISIAADDGRFASYTSVYDLMAKSHVLVGQTDSFRHYSALSEVYQDSLDDRVRAATLLELEEKYLNKEQAAQLLVQEQEISTARTRMFIILGVLFFAVLSGVILWRLSARLRRRNVEVEQLVSEKTTLIGEIHHRTKNNLQMISGLLSLQSGSLQVEDHSAKSALKESQTRVQAMGLIHQKLYQEDHVTAIDLPDYLRELGDTLIQAYAPDGRVELTYEVEDIQLDVDTAIPLGLIINELLTNSLKYAFSPAAEGSVTVRAFRDGKELITVVTDNGRGADPAAPARGTGFGSRLLRGLTKQLGGSLTVDSAEGYRTELRIALPV